MRKTTHPLLERYGKKCTILTVENLTTELKNENTISRLLTSLELVNLYFLTRKKMTEKTRKQMIDFLLTPNKAFKVFCEPTEYNRLMKEAKASREAKSDEEIIKAYNELMSIAKLM